MSTVSPASPSATPEFGSALHTRSQAVYLALVFGAIGAVVGFVSTRLQPHPPLVGPGSFGLWAACAATVVAGLVSAFGYWRAQHRPGQEWRHEVATWTATVNTISVVLVHSALAFLATYAMFAVLAQALIGFPVLSFFGTVMMAATCGLTAYLVFPSVADMTTQRMATLLLAYVVIGALTSAVTTSDPEWWKVHFSQLGTYGDVSSWMFNATLVVAGLLVTTFAVYISHDMNALVNAGRLTNKASPRMVSGLFVAMGVMLAGVGVFPVDLYFGMHTACASGVAVAFLVLLIRGRRHLAGMPSGYFVASFAFLLGVAGSVVLWLTRVFSLTALEVSVFTLIFAWIVVFIRFLGLTEDREPAQASA